MSWVAVAIAGGAATALGKGILANQRKQANKGYIDQSYNFATQKLDYKQAGAREGTAEDLNARGLAQGGSVNASPIHTAMMNGLTTSLSRPNTAGAQVTSDEGVQMGLESQDLENQYKRAKQTNRADYANSLLDAGVSGVAEGESIFTGGKNLSSMRSGIHSAMLSGTSFDGVHPNDPLGDPTSAWSTHPSKLAIPTQSTASFGVNT